MKVRINDEKCEGMFDDEFNIRVGNVSWFAHKDEIIDDTYVKIYGYSKESGSVFARYSGGNIEWFQINLPPTRIEEYTI